MTATTDAGTAGGWRARRAARRQERALEVQLPDIARALARGVAAGLPLAEACVRAAAALDPPASSVLARVAVDLAAGARPEQALAPLAVVPGAGLLRGAVVLHDELGGDLAHGLHALADGLADRARLDGELRAVTAQARLAARLVPGVPVATAAMLAAASPASLRPLLGTAPGLAVVGVSGALTGVGLLLVRRIMASAAA
jgi:tight adherence protein B